MPLCPCKQRQDHREQHRAHEQDCNANAGRVAVKLAVLVFDQIVEQVDWHYEERTYHERDQCAGQDVDAGLGIVDLFGGAGFECIFL